MNFVFICKNLTRVERVRNACKILVGLLKRAGCLEDRST